MMPTFLCWLLGIFTCCRLAVSYSCHHSILIALVVVCFQVTQAPAAFNDSARFEYLLHQYLPSSSSTDVTNRSVADGFTANSSNIFITTMRLATLDDVSSSSAQRADDASSGNVDPGYDISKCKHNCAQEVLSMCRFTLLNNSKAM